MNAMLFLAVRTLFFLASLMTAIAEKSATSTVGTSSQCSAPADVANAKSQSCREGPRVDNGGRCTTRCKDSSFVPNVNSLSCSGSTLVPATFTCGPRPSKGVVLKGFSYRPFWGGGAAQTNGVWGDGVAHLASMKTLGANAVRLYGNSHKQNHKTFLDEAKMQGLKVIACMNDALLERPQGLEVNLLNSSDDYTVYNIIKEQFLGNLKNGFTTEGKNYHEALGTLVLVNEMDLKTGARDPESPTAIALFQHAIVSAFDAVMQAEKEHGVESPGLKLTATVSSHSHDARVGCRTNCHEFVVKSMVALREASGNLAGLAVASPSSP